MEPQWTLSDLVAEVAARISALPAPRNGQVRAIPDERTVRYYATIGLLDRPSAMRGRTALYGLKHVAQVVAIKRMQATGRSLSEIQALWPTLDDHTLARMSGVALATRPVKAASGRGAFWKREARGSEPALAEPAPLAPTALAVAPASAAAPMSAAAPASPVAPASAASAASATAPVPAASPASAAAPVSAAEPALAESPEAAPAAVELRLELAPHVVLLLSVVDEHVTISPADVRAIRAAAAPILAELASRRLAPHSEGDQS